MSLSAYPVSTLSLKASVDSQSWTQDTEQGRPLLWSGRVFFLSLLMELRMEG